MKLIVDQESVIYKYRCLNKCDRCYIRFLCYTTCIDNFLKLKGTPLIDILIAQSRLDGIIISEGSIVQDWGM